MLKVKGPTSYQLLFVTFRDAANAAFRVRVARRNPKGGDAGKVGGQACLSPPILHCIANLCQQIKPRRPVLVYRRERAHSVVNPPTPNKGYNNCNAPLRPSCGESIIAGQFGHPRTIGVQNAHPR